MNATRKVKLSDINANLTCKLCMGYLVDATTIIECLHSFCKSCIIKYLEKSADLEEKYFCPICEIQLHETKPLTSIRSDLMLQEIVYKLVPGLFKDEMSRRRNFYQENEKCTPTNPLDSGQVFDELYITSDDLIHLSMEYVTDDVKLKESTKRYLKCPAAVSIFILKKFLQGKYDLEMGTKVDIMFGDRILPDDFLLMDVAYKYSWTMNGSKPLSLRYRINGPTKPTIKTEKTINDTVPIIPVKQSQPEAQKKKVCNENGSNIMPTKETKNNPIKIPGNGLLSGEMTIAPIKNAKVKNRKRKLPAYSDIVIEIKDDMKNIAKKLKFPKQDAATSKSQPCSPYQSSATVEIIPSKDLKTKPKSGETEEGKEVQLQISENGVMSARSVTVGGNSEEKIILNLSPAPGSTPKSNPSPTSSHNANNAIAEKLLLSGNFHSKTGPSGVTEIICDKPDPSLGGLKSIAPKPGYVTLNIPNPSSTMMHQNQRSPTIIAHDKMKKLPVTNLHDPPSTSPNLARHHAKSPYDKKQTEKLSKPNIMEKLKNRIVAKGKDGENVIKAITDLGKLCNSSSSNGITMIASNNNTVAECKTKMSGVHTHPIISALSSHLQPVPKQKAATTSNSNFPFSLNFPPSSGMTVSMIPCTSSASTTNNMNGNNINISTNSVQSTTPPKRISLQTTIVNGDLKFTPSPKQPPLTLNGDHGTPSKKPPKFFKSRHTTSPTAQKITSPSQRPAEVEVKRKTPIHMGNGTGEPKKKKIKESINGSTKSPSPTGLIAPNSASPRSLQSASSFATVSSTNGNESRPIPYPSQSTESAFSQQLKAMNGGMVSLASTEASFGLAAAAAVAAATANGNGIRPFLPENYSAIPFGYTSLLSQLMLPQYYNAINYSGATTPSNVNPTMSLNLTKPKSNSPPNPSPNFHQTSPILNGALSDAKSKSEVTSSSTLDLSVGKSNGTNNGDEDKETEKHPLLSNLLNNKTDPKETSTPTSSPSQKMQQEVKKTRPSSTSPVENKKNGNEIKASNESVGTHKNGPFEKLDTPEHNGTPATVVDKTEKSVESGKSADNTDGNVLNENNCVAKGSRNDLSSPSNDMLLSQNNNNHSTSETFEKDKSEGNSLSTSSSTNDSSIILKKNLDCAKQINDDKSNKCNGNNNVPAHVTEINTNSGSA